MRSTLATPHWLFLDNPKSLQAKGPTETLCPSSNPSCSSQRLAWCCSYFMRGREITSTTEVNCFNNYFICFLDFPVTAESPAAISECSARQVDINASEELGNLDRMILSLSWTALRKRPALCPMWLYSLREPLRSLSTREALGACNRCRPSTLFATRAASVTSCCLWRLGRNNSGFSDHVYILIFKCRASGRSSFHLTSYASRRV